MGRWWEPLSELSELNCVLIKPALQYKKLKQYYRLVWANKKFAKLLENLDLDTNCKKSMNNAYITCSINYSNHSLVLQLWIISMNSSSQISIQYLNLMYSGDALVMINLATYGALKFALQLHFMEICYSCSKIISNIIIISMKSIWQVINHTGDLSNGSSRERI